MANKTFGLALGAGAMRGMCHIGVLEVLEQHNLVPDMISGTSMGAIIGGLYAAGVSIDQMKEILATLRKKDVVDFFNIFGFRGNGFLSGNKSENIIRELCGDINIEDCKIPFVAVAVDVVSGKTVYFDKGNLTDAIRASYAVPGVFAPVKMGNMLLMDGGLKERIPVNILRDKGAKYVVGVNPCESIIEGKYPASLPEQIGRMFEIMDWEITRNKLHEADFVLSIKSKLMSSANVSEARIAYEQGYEAAAENIELIKKRIHRKDKKFSGIFRKRSK